MSSRESEALRKAICKSLAAAVREDPWQGRIEPQAFFMAVNQHYDRLYAEGRFNLVPLFGALSEQLSPSELIDLFLVFQRQLAKLGVAATVPKAVEDRLEALLADPPSNAFNEVDAELQTSEFVLVEPGRIAEAMPLSLSQDLSEKRLSPSLRREITQAAVNAVQFSPIGERISPGRFAYLVDSHFDELYDGESFRFDPILTGLRAMPGVADRDIFPVVQMMRQQLGSKQIAVKTMDLNVSEADAAWAMGQAEARRELLRSSRPSQDLGPGRASGDGIATKQASSAEDPGPPLSVPASLTRDIEINHGPQPRKRPWRAIGLGGLLILILVLSFVFRTNKNLDPADYQSGLPLLEAKLVDGAFIGTLDDAAWSALSLSEQKARFEAFCAQIRHERRVPELQIRDSQHRLVVIAQDKGLRAADIIWKRQAPGSASAAP